MKTFIYSCIASVLFTMCFLYLPNKLQIDGGKITSELNKENRDFPEDRLMKNKMFSEKEFPYAYYKKLLLTEFSNYHSSRKNSKNSFALNWQLEGPKNIGGRVMATVVNKKNQNVILIGTAAGGIFKTKDGGLNWYPVFDNNAFLSISDLCYDPSDTNVIYAGTGDKVSTLHSTLGNGIYKSVDGGETWNSFGLSEAYAISKIIVHPTNSAIIYANIYGIGDLKNGIYKTINNGQTWGRIFGNDSTVRTYDLEMFTQNPNILYTASIDHNYRHEIFKSLDGGNTWSLIFNGVNQGIGLVGKMGIAISEQNPNKIYLSVTKPGNIGYEKIFASQNGGLNWFSSPATGLQPNVFSNLVFYFEQIFVNPYNQNHVMIGGVDFPESINGGSSFSNLHNNYHVDIHNVCFIDSINYLVSTDGGVYKMTLGLTAAKKIDDIPNTQFYRVNYNMNNPTKYVGGTQDNGTVIGNSTTINSWKQLWGGDGFTCQFPRNNSAYFYAESQYGNIYYIDTINQLVSPVNIPNTEKRNWDAPYLISKYSNDVMYSGTTEMYEGDAKIPNSIEWRSISPTLSDGYFGISSIDEGLSQGKLVVGTSEGNVWKRDIGSTTWQKIKGSDLNSNYISSVKYSPNINSNIYYSTNSYSLFDKLQHIYKSIDEGATWANISTNLPNFGINDIYIWNGNENIIFIANDIGVYYTLNGGNSWDRLGTNMPFIPVLDIDYNPVLNRLFVGTYARGIQSIDITNIVKSEVAIQNNYSINLYPNPAADILNINTHVSSVIEKKSIYGIKGQLVYQDSSINKSIDISTLQKGYYLLVINSNGNKIAKKFVKE
jgi:photosystem II stability/assembly factor-like uncharacterized protein